MYTLIRYRDWAPTAFDTKGLGLPDQQDWFVFPMMRTRDSGCLTEHNFETVVECFKGFEVETHRFSHWGPGWFELILIRPGDGAIAKAESLIEELEAYPILNEHAWCMCDECSECFSG